MPRVEVGLRGVGATGVGEDTIGWGRSRENEVVVMVSLRLSPSGPLGTPKGRPLVPEDVGVGPV